MEIKYEFIGDRVIYDYYSISIDGEPKYKLIRNNIDFLWELRKIDSDIVIAKNQYRYDILDNLETIIENHGKEKG